MNQKMILRNSCRIPKLEKGYGVIYTLSDPRSGEVRYVGKSVNPKGRYYSHIYTSERKMDGSGGLSHKSNWIGSLLKQGVLPIMEILEILEESLLSDAEMFWMIQMKCWGFKLTNTIYASIGTSSLIWKSWLSLESSKDIISQVVKDAWSKPGSVHRSDEVMKKRSEGLKAAWKDEHSGYNSGAYKERHSQGIRRAMENPLTKYHSQEFKDLKSKQAINAWGDSSSKHHRRKIPIFSENPFTGEILYYESLNHAGRLLEIHPSKILNNINYVGKSKKKMGNLKENGPFCFYKTNGDIHPYLKEMMNANPSRTKTGIPYL